MYYKCVSCLLILCCFESHSSPNTLPISSSKDIFHVVTSLFHNFGISRFVSGKSWLNMFLICYYKVKLGLVLEFSEAAEQNILALLLMVLLPYLLHFISPWYSISTYNIMN